MALVHDKIRAALKDCRWTLRRAANEAGINYTTLHSSLSNRRAISFDMIDALAQAMGISVQYFSDRNTSLVVDEFHSVQAAHKRAHAILDNALQTTVRQIAYEGRTIGLESFLDWWYAHNGRLENFDGLANYVDLFTEPKTDARQISPAKIGAQSLATLCFSSENEAHLRETLNGFTAETNDSLLQAHIYAMDRGEPVLSHPKLNETLRNGQQFERQYRRVLAPIHLPGGSRLIANFSQDIGSAKIGSEDVK